MSNPSLTSSAQPPPSAPEPVSRAGLLLLLAVLTLSHLYPQGAFPGWSIVLGAGLLAAFVVAAWGALRAGRASRAALRPAPVMAFLAGAGWMLWWGVRQGAAPVPALARPDVATIFQGYLVFATAACLVIAWRLEQHPAAPDPGAVVPRWGMVLAGVLALHALYQVLGPEGLPGTHATLAAALEREATGTTDPTLEGILHALREGRASGRLGSPNVFAGLMVLGLPLALGAARGRWRIPGLLTAALLAWGVVLSGSRGGLLAFVAATGVFGLLALGGVRWRRGATAAVSALFLAVMLTGAASDGGDNGLARRWLGMTTVQQRLHYWETGWAIWRDAPLAGRGPGAFEVFYPLHRVPGAQETGYAHSWVFQWGSEVGFVGLALFAAWMGCSLLAGWRWWCTARAEGSRGQVLLASGVLAALAGALAHGLVEFTLQFREIHLDMALMAGIATGLGAVAGSARQPAHAVPARMLAAPAVLVLVAGGLSWFQNGLAPGMADRAREQAEWRLEESDPEAAVAAYTRALRWAPDDPRLHEARAFARAAAGDPRGEDDLLRALALHPSSARLHASRAQWLAMTGRREEALDWQRQAVDLHPLDGTHRLELAQMLLELGRAEEARQALATTDGLLLTPLEHQRLDALSEQAAEP